MREWMMGNVDGWINPSSRSIGGRMPSFYRALGVGCSHMDFLFLYEDGRLLAVRNIKPWLEAFVQKHGYKPDSIVAPDDAHYHTYVKLGQKPWLREQTEQELVELLTSKGQ